METDPSISLEDNDSPKHHCGVAGVFCSEPSNVPKELFYMLFSLQHRGQESAGISWDESGNLRTEKGLGMVSGVLSKHLSEEHRAFSGIGHVRYSTAGGSGIQNAQPIAVDCNKGKIALAHNGNISNGVAIRDRLVAEGSIFQATADSELILHLISKSRSTHIRDIIRDAFSPLEGAFSILMLWNGSLVAIRDPKGFRPLLMAKSNGNVYFASESCALVRDSAEVREVAPGECVIVSQDGVESFMYTELSAPRRCVFELIYFARPDSRIFGESVHVVRKRLGAALADIEDVEADIVIPVPDSGNIAAIGYAERSGIPFDFGLSRNHYAGRSFIMPTKGQREFAVKMKLQPVPEVVSGKRVILIDDSLVRGTTSKIIVRLLKEAGAKEVHVRLSSPEVHWPCYYGIDVPTREELISNRLDPHEIAEHIGAESVKFLSVDQLRGVVSEPDGYCRACFDGDYPCPVYSTVQK